MIGDMSQDSDLCVSKLTLAGFPLETSREEMAENLCETLDVIWKRAAETKNIIFPVRVTKRQLNWPLKCLWGKILT